MTPVSAAAGFQLMTSGKFEAQHLEPKQATAPLAITQAAAESPKLAIGPAGTAAAPKLVMDAHLAGPDGKANAAAASAGAKGQKVDPQLQRAAREFEAIFLRNLLKPLEQVGSTGKSSMSAGSDVYGSMMVGALADSASSGGGIGLAHLVLEALTRGEAAGNSTK